MFNIPHLILFLFLFDHPANNTHSIIFAVWCSFQAVTIYLFAPETKGRTLEELDEIFASPNPRKASTQKKKAAIDTSGNIVETEVL